MDEYGDGFLLAACTLLHLLHQRHRFEAADFTSHLLRVSEYHALGKAKAEEAQVVDECVLCSSCLVFTQCYQPPTDRLLVLLEGRWAGKCAPLSRWPPQHGAG